MDQQIAFNSVNTYPTVVPDERLGAYASRVAGKVVVLTGGGSGIGREAALLFSKHGAKVVIGDRDETGTADTIALITSSGGVATSVKCDVTVWENQLALFQHALRTFGSVDIVIPNAGVSERGNFETIELEDGVPTKPNLTTIEINLIGVLYTARLAIHYLSLNRKPGSLKALIFVGSMASWQALPTAPTYSASKHGILGLMRSLHHSFEAQDIRIGCVHPFFVLTPLVPVPVRLFLAGIPLAKVESVVGAILYAVTHPDPATSGAAWLIVDDGPVVQVVKEEFRLGVYKMLDERRLGLLRKVSTIRHYGNVTREVAVILFGRWAVLLLLIPVTAAYLWTTST